MLKLLGVLFMAFFMIGIVFAGWIFAYVKRWMERRRQARLASLRAQHQRLTRVVNILLEKANEVDQEILYLGTTLPIPDTAKLAQACSNLVMLSESLPVIDQLLVREELDNSRDAILSSCRIAMSISNDIAVVRHSAVRHAERKQTV
jgi:hypothetical protein